MEQYGEKYKNLEFTTMMIKITNSLVNFCLFHIFQQKISMLYLLLFKGKQQQYYFNNLQIIFQQLGSIAVWGKSYHGLYLGGTLELIMIWKDGISEWMQRLRKDNSPFTC